MRAHTEHLSPALHRALETLRGLRPGERSYQRYSNAPATHAVLMGLLEARGLARPVRHRDGCRSYKATDKTASKENIMGMQKSDLGRQYILDVDAAGNVFIRERDSGNVPRGLPVFSADTHELAKMIRVTHCRLARDHSGLYTLNNPPHDVAGLGAVSDLFRATHAALLAKKDPPAPTA